MVDQRTDLCIDFRNQEDGNVSTEELKGMESNNMVVAAPVSLKKTRGI